MCVASSEGATLGEAAAWLVLFAYVEHQLSFLMPYMSLFSEPQLLHLPGVILKLDLCLCSDSKPHVRPCSVRRVQRPNVRSSGRTSQVPWLWAEHIVNVCGF